LEADVAADMTEPGDGREAEPAPLLAPPQATEPTLSNPHANRTITGLISERIPILNQQTCPKPDRSKDPQYWETRIPCLIHRTLKTWGMKNNELRKIRDGYALQGFMYLPQASPIPLDGRRVPLGISSHRQD
jgi:hypothetical protein